MSQQFDSAIQRQINSRLTVEVGYIERILTHEFQPIDCERRSLRDDHASPAIRRSVRPDGLAVFQR